MFYHETMFSKIALAAIAKCMLSNNLFKVNRLFNWCFKIYWYYLFDIVYLIVTTDRQFSVGVLHVSINLRCYNNLGVVKPYKNSFELFLIKFIFSKVGAFTEAGSCQGIFLKNFPKHCKQLF